ncbi:MAG: hypothetical protein E6H77_04405 [Betaproteobacteria bacterium]|nr:MAG: hypothetical protein E6H77_04405 [Betaproteobacteria bacterium]
MNRLVLVLLAAFSAAFSIGVYPQNRSAQLDQAYDEVRTAYTALQQASARRDQGVESLPGERTGSAAGGSRPNENYFARQAILEQEIELARKRYEAALKRWNDLK